MESDDWKQPSAEELARKVKEEEIYMHGYREGKREVYQHGRGLAIGLFLILLWVSPIGLLCFYALGAVIMIYHSISQDKDKKLVNRLIGATFAGALWPLILFIDAMKASAPSKTIS